MDDLQAAAPAPADETTPDEGEAQALEAAYDRITGGKEPDPEPEVAPPEAEDAHEGEADGAEPEPEPEAEAKPAPPMPSDLSPRLKEAWGKLDEAGRSALVEVQRGINARMAEQGRIVQATKPIHDVLVRAVQELPGMRDMTPDQVARDVFLMAQIQGQLATDPIGTILGIAQKYGALDGIRQALTGQQAPNGQQSVQMAQEIRQLRAMLQQQMDPAALENRVMQTLTTRDTERMVDEFAKGKEHWAAVEAHLPQMIPLAQQEKGPGASAKDVLDLAYDMAVHAFPSLRAKASSAAQAPVRAAIPDRSEAQRRAKSVNVTSRAAGRPTSMSEEDALGAVYDRVANR